MIELSGLSPETESAPETEPAASASGKKLYMPIKKLKSRSKLPPGDQIHAHHRNFNVTKPKKLRSPELEPQFEIPRDKIEETHSQIEELLKEKIAIDPAEAERREFRERIGTQIVEAARDRCRSFQLETNHRKHFLLDRKFTDSLNKAAKANLLENFKIVPIDPDQSTQPRVLLTNPDFKRYFDLDKRMFGQLDGTTVEALTHARMKEKGEIAAQGKKFLSYYEGLLKLGEDQMQKLSLMKKTQSASQQQRVRRMQANREFFHSMSQEIDRAEKIREIRLQHQHLPDRNSRSLIPTELSASGSQVDLVEYAKSGGQRRGLSIVERFMRRTIQQTEKVTFHLDEIAHQHQLEKRTKFAKLRSSSIMEGSMSNLVQRPKIRFLRAIYYTIMISRIRFRDSNSGG